MLFSKSRADVVFYCFYSTYSTISDTILRRSRFVNALRQNKEATQSVVPNVRAERTGLENQIRDTRHRSDLWKKR